MFDIGFTELLIVAVVALVVVGPERLPSLIKTMLMYIRKIKSGFNSIRDEVEKELDLDGIKEEITGVKTDMSNVVGYEALQESIDSLKEESEKLKDIANDGFEYANNIGDFDEVSDEDIEADMAEFDKIESEKENAQKADEFAGTGEDLVGLGDNINTSDKS